MRHEMITHPTRDFGKEIPRNLRGYWFTRVDQLSEGDKFFRIDCDLTPCTAQPCIHDPKVLTDVIYQVIKVEPWGTPSPLLKVYTDQGYFVAKTTDSACIIESDGEKVQSVLDDPETNVSAFSAETVLASSPFRSNNWSADEPMSKVVLDEV